MAHWLMFVVLVTLVERIITASHPLSDELSEDYPLTKSLGIFIRNRNSNVLEDNKALSKEFVKKYQEITKISKESFENFEHRRVAADNTELELMSEASVSLQNRRRRFSSNKVQSTAELRHARSLALRRSKLNRQSLKSHVYHSKISNLDYEYIND